MKFYYAILWDDEGLESLVDLTDEVSPEAQEMETFNIIAGRAVKPAIAGNFFVTSALRSRYNSHRNVEAWAFVHELPTNELIAVFNERPEEIKALIRKTGEDICRVVKFN